MYHIIETFYMQAELKKELHVSLCVTVVESIILKTVVDNFLVDIDE